MYLAKLYKDINYLDNMKKILLFTSILFFAFGLSGVKAQTIDSVVVTTPILCFGDVAEATCYITQTSPPTPLNYILEKFTNKIRNSFQELRNEQHFYPDLMG